jgi:NAD-dependent aldehyde dehydrogenases
MNIKDIMETMDYGPAPEASTDVGAWLESRGRVFGHFIDGSFTGAGNASIEVENPATGEVIARIPEGTEAEVNAAVAAAKEAFPAWSRLPGFERARYLYAIARHLQQRERFFSVLESIDNGKPIKETRNADIPLAIRHFYHHAGWAAAIDTEFPGHEALGVCGQIIPWNFPLLMLAWKIAPALAAGNTVVLKPADLTPLTAIAFAELLVEIGLPKGVVNIVHGGGATGALIVRHPDIAKIAFTGSTAVGREIRRATAGSGKKLSLELGGKSPFIVCADADLGCRRGRRGRGRVVQPGRGLLCRLPPDPAGGDCRPLPRQAARPHGAPARGRSARQVDRHGRHRFCRSEGAHHWPSGGREGGRLQARAVVLPAA